MPWVRCRARPPFRSGPIDGDHALRRRSPGVRFSRPTTGPILRMTGHLHHAALRALAITDLEDASRWVWEEPFVHISGKSWKTSWERLIHRHRLVVTEWTNCE